MDRLDSFINVSNKSLTLSVRAEPFNGIVTNHETGESWQFDIAGSLIYSLSGTGQYQNVHLTAAESFSRGTGGFRACVVIEGKHFATSVWLDEKESDVHFELESLDSHGNGEPVSGESGTHHNLLLKEIDARIGTESSNNPLRSIHSIRFPGPILPVDSMVSELILPIIATQGLSHRPETGEEWHKEFLIWENGLSMPLWGVMGKSGGVLTIVETPDDCGVIMDKKHGTGLEVEPFWVPSLGQFDTARRMTACFTMTPHYADMALRYRRYIMEHGRFKSLKQKIEERPAVRKLLGAPYVYLGYQPLSETLVKRVMNGMKTMGYETCLFGPLSVNAWDNMWMNDYIPLINLGKEVYKHCEKLGYLPYAWEWLEDMLETNRFFSKDVPYVKADGNIAEGWSNRDFRYRLVCSKVLEKLYKELLPQVAHVPALHMDVTTHIPVKECWHAGHAITRTQDVQYKHERMKGYAGAGKVFGSEGGYDWAFDLYDFCSTNPRIGSLTDSDYRYIPVPNRLIPFMGIVYHDSVLMYWYEQDTYMRDRNDMMKWFHHVQPGPEDYGYRDKLLFDIMAGNPPTLSPCGAVFDMDMLNLANEIKLKWVTYDDPRTQAILRDALQVSKNHAKVGLMQMTDQRYLDGQRLVSRTVYEDGTAAYVNFGTEPFYTDGGEMVAPQDWISSIR